MKNSAIRMLSAEEMALVCGGSANTTVTVRPDPGDYPDGGGGGAFPDFGDGGGWEDGGGGGGGSSGSGDGDTREEQIEQLAIGFMEIAELRRGGIGVVGTIFASLDYGMLSAGTAGQTMNAGLADIRFFRDTGMHSPSSYMSLIPWHAVQVDWSLYDQGGTDADVMRNFLESLRGG